LPDIKWSKKEDIPEVLREHAVEKDGAFVVDVAPAVKVKEFRDNNVALLRERDELKSKLTPYTTAFGEDVVAATTRLSELQAIEQQVKDGTLKGTDAINRQVDERVKSERANFETAKKALETQLATLTQTASQWEGKYKGERLNQEVAAHVLIAVLPRPHWQTSRAGRARSGRSTPMARSCC
jgi:hypothetical protein